MKIHQPLILCLALALTACASTGPGQGLGQLQGAGLAGGPRIDGSTGASIQSSLAAINLQRSERDRCLLANAMAQIQAGVPAGTIGQYVNNKTFDQVIEMSNNYPKLNTVVCSV